MSHCDEGDRGGSDPPRERPNILLIITDDQRDDTMRAMPRTRAIFGAGGTRFTEAYAPTPVCCPSRATIFSGRYAHNHNVLTNADALELDQSATFQHALQKAGYQSAIVGKYLNSWNQSAAPPDFDRWAFFSKVIGTGSDGYHDVAFNIEGTVAEVARYSTSFIRDKAVDYLSIFETSDDQPWLLVVAPFAPHGPAVPEQRYKDAPVGAVKSNPAVHETDRSDKPPFVQAIQPADRGYLDSREGAAFQKRQLRTLLSVDDLVARLFEKLRALGEDNETLAIFTSDNGVFSGEHGMSLKSLPYTQAIDVPLYVRWPDHVVSGRVDDRLVGLQDVAPTILDAAGLDAEWSIDGVSLFESHERDYFLLEAWKEPFLRLPPWAGIFVPGRYKYVEYYDDAGSVTFAEFYDLATDPWELTNRSSPASSRQRRLAKLLERARSCVGESCP